MLIKQNQTAHPLEFLLVSNSDHVTGVTGAAPTVKISKNGAAGVTPAGAVSEVDAVNLPGLYKIAANATDCNTVGQISIHATATGADPVDDKSYQVVGFDPDLGFITIVGGTSGAGNAAPIDSTFEVGTDLYWSQTVAAVGLDSTGWTKMVLTVKADVANDLDAAALIVVRVTNPSAGGADGLLVLNGAAAGDATKGSLVVNGFTPDTTVTWVLQAEAMDIPPSGDRPYGWELDRFTGTRKERIGQGTIQVDRSVRRGVAAP